MHPPSLTFVGSGDAFSSGGRLQSGIFIETQAGGLLIDCGTTLLTGLQRVDLNTDQIDAVAVSHLHGDHFGGIPFLLLDALFIQKRTKPLQIIGPIGLDDRVKETCRALYPGALDGPLPFAVSYHHLDLQQSTDYGFFSITAREVSHGEHSAACGLRIVIAERTIAYSGDTNWTESLIDLAKGTDLFICECCNFDQSSPAHLDYLTLKQHLPELATGRIILTHTGPEIDVNRHKITLEVASDGLCLQL